MADKRKILSLYKLLLRESSKFDSYNFRNYALRRIRDAFRENSNLKDETKIQQQVEFANENLRMIRRQVALGKMYASEKLVIENKP